MSDVNQVRLEGVLATPPELKVFESGSELVRLLVVSKVRLPRRRVDVLPVTVWNEEFIDNWSEVVELQKDERVFVTGSLQRRYWSESGGRHSRMEVVAESVERVE